MNTNDINRYDEMHEAIERNDSEYGYLQGLDSESLRGIVMNFRELYEATAYNFEQYRSYVEEYSPSTHYYAEQKIEKLTPIAARKFRDKYE